MKKLFFIILIFINIILFADGIEPIGSGTENNPYQIGSLDNLLWIATNPDFWDKYFIQVANINASSTQFWNAGEGFLPIGTDSINFTGNYNGGNYVIDSLYINRENSSYQALFAYLKLASLSNISLTNINIKGNNYVAGIASYCYDSDIINCSVEGNVQGTEQIGGLIGECDFFSTIDSCCNYARIIGNNQVGGIVAILQRSSNINHSHNEEKVTGYSSVGGIAGYSYNSFISYCYNNARINIANRIGGIVGDLCFSTVSYCYNNGEIKGGYVGGIAGFCSDNCVITNCYNTGHIIGQSAGGLIGYNEDSYAITKSYNTGFVDGEDTGDVIGGLIGWNFNSAVANCYSTGDVRGDRNIAGFIVVNNDNCSVYNCYSTGNITFNYTANGFIGGFAYCENCFWDIETSGQTTSMGGGTGKTTQEMKNIATYTSTSTDGLNTPWDFVNNPFDDNANENIWDINSAINNGYPFLATLPTVESEDMVINDLPENPLLKGNYPNPFNPSTTISFSIPKESDVKITIYNLKGQKVKTLIHKRYEKGLHKIVWNGTNSNNKIVSSGVYFYKFDVNGKTKAIKKCLMIK